MKKENLNEMGRSMMEMLGTLAIMGVLTTLGIYGFRVAMAKLHANELINESNRRALSVATQLQMNKRDNLHGFTQNDFGYGTFTSDPILAQNGQFKIGIEGVEQNVCDQMQSAAGGIIQSFSPDSCTETNTVLLTYNNDLSEAIASGGNTSGGNSAREPLPEDGPTADDDSTCSGERKGECQVCHQGVYVDSDAYCLAHGGGACVDGECKTLGCTSNGDCRTSNPNQCGNGECFCSFNNLVNGCSGPTKTGNCVLKTTKYRGTTVIDNHEFVMGRYVVDGVKNLDWWSAKNFCAAYGKRMMTLAELGCTTSSCPSNALFWRIIASGYVGATWVLDLDSNCQGYYPTQNNGVRVYALSLGDSSVICY